MTPKRVCVYCGSSPGRAESYLAAARELGTSLPGAGYNLVYGGASIGIMGTVADSVLAAGGSVFGVIPESLARREVAHANLTELHITSSMHERKLKMADMSDAFIALPGGLGTLEELFEIWTWAQLGFHTKPIAILNVDGYFDALIAFLDQSVEAGFVNTAHRQMLINATGIADLLQQIEDYESPAVDKLTGGGEQR